MSALLAIPIQARTVSILGEARRRVVGSSVAYPARSSARVLHRGTLGSRLEQVDQEPAAERPEVALRRLEELRLSSAVRG